MSIRVKILGAIIITFFILFLFLFFIAQQVILGSFSQLEQQSSLANIERVLNNLADEIEELGVITADQAYQADGYAFVRGDNPTYPQDHWTAAALDNLDIDIVAISDSDGGIRYVNFSRTEQSALAEALARHFNRVIEDNLIGSDDPTGAVEGMIRLPDGGLALIATRAVLRNADREGPPSGLLTFIRMLDDEEIGALRDDLKLDIEFYLFGSPTLPADVRAAAGQLSAASPLTVQIASSEIIHGYGLIFDLDQQPIGYVKIRLPRSVFLGGWGAVRQMSLVIAGIGITLCLMVYLVLNHVVIDRFTRLSRFVEDIRQTGNTAPRLVVSSDDEISRLEHNINSMLDQIEVSQIELKSNNQTLSTAYLQAEEATRLKSEFLAKISHELRTPLTAILGYTELILEGINGKIDEDARESLVRVHESGHHLLNIVNDLLDLSSIEANALFLQEHEYDLRAMIESLHGEMAVVARQQHVNFEAWVADSVPSRLLGDEQRVRQIINNLLSNAFKFTSMGSVRLEVFCTDILLKIQVADTGIGIEPEMLKHIFQSFRQGDNSTTRRYGGVGLGLSIVQHLVRAMEGYVKVESVTGKGSTFIVTLPLKVPSQTSVKV